MWKTSMRARMLAFALGVGLVAFWPRLTPWQGVMLTGFLASLAGPLAGRAGCKRLDLLLSLSGFLCLGIGWHLVRAEGLLQQRLPAELEGQDLLVSGHVASIPERRGAGQQFRFRVESGPEQFSNRTVLLNAYEGEAYQAGQVWQLRIRLQRPHGFANPGTFDYEAWLLQQGISARGYVRRSADNRLLGNGRVSLLRLRSGLRDRLLRVTDGMRFQPLFLALALGDRSQLPDEQWQVFTRTGTNHLVVISGLHVALVAGLAALLTARLWRCSAALLGRFPAQQAGALGAIAAALGYSMLAGFALPTQRALLMVSVYMLTRLLGLRASPSFTLLAAATLVLLVNPLAVASAGFWLSFSAVAGLLLVFSGLSTSRTGRLRRAWRAFLVPQLVVWVALLVPLGIWLGKISLIAPLANLLAVPVVSWIIVPLCLLASLLTPGWPSLAQLVFAGADTLAGYLLGGLNWLATLPVSGDGWPVNVGSAAMLVLVAASAPLLLLPLGPVYRLMALLMLLPYLWPMTQRPGEHQLALHVLDVGQGLAVLIQTPNHALVYDTGPKFSSGFDSGAAIVGPVLRRLGVEHVDRLVVSHADNDHAGGAAGLLAATSVTELFAGEPIEVPAIASTPCRRGQQWTWDRVRFRILHPDDGSTSRASSGNNSSCVLEIQLDGVRILLPGDIEAEVERQLLTETQQLAPLDVLISAHHGSNTSSTWAFIARTRPALVVHSAGYRNQFGHPASRVRERFSAMGSRQLLTAEEGMISLFYSPDPGRLEVRSYRREFRRYWQWSDIQPTGRY